MQAGVNFLAVSQMFELQAKKNASKIAIVYNQNKENFSWPKQGTLKDRIYQIFGKEVFEQVLPVKFSNESINVSGFISQPALNYSNRNQRRDLIS